MNTKNHEKQHTKERALQGLLNAAYEVLFSHVYLAQRVHVTFTLPGIMGNYFTFGFFANFTPATDYGK